MKQTQMTTALVRFFVAFLCIFAMVATLSGCDDAVESTDGSASQTARIGTITLRTVEYDGHLWIIVGNAYGGMGVCHHPDCAACQGD